MLRSARITGDSKYQDWAWDAFVAINATTRTPSGFTSISDVNALGGGDKYNNQESFFFAEVLKYSFLIQAPASIPLRMMVDPTLTHCGLGRSLADQSQRR